MKAITHTAADCAEQAGSMIGNRLLNDLLATDNQGTRIAMLQAAILKLAELQHHDRAAGGFAVALVNTLEIGLENLPKSDATMTRLDALAGRCVRGLPYMHAITAGVVLQQLVGSVK
jgi:hypothetical protein